MLDRDVNRFIRFNCLQFLHKKGCGDAVQCHHCNGVLSNWKKEDDIWNEHARHYPKCEFLRFMKGSDFVASCKSSDSGLAEDSIEIISNKFDCKICLAKDIEIAFSPCGHTSCRRCAEKLVFCAFCRTDIDLKLNLFFC